MPVSNALLSVYYKTDNFSEMAGMLHKAGVQLYSSGGTAKHILGLKIPVTDVAEYTGYPALFGHRVVTLHPKIHGGILYRRDNPQDVEEAKANGIVPFDLVVVNFYPARETIAKPGATEADVVESIDIGGPTMVKAAAKNFMCVAVVMDIDDYMPVANEIQENSGLTLLRRRELAVKAFREVGDYYRTIGDFLGGEQE